MLREGLPMRSIDLDFACGSTSYVERQNLTMRMGTDPYGRTLARVRVNARDAGQNLVSQ
jgi:endonuclease YncB( thermonuclease family)